MSTFKFILQIVSAIVTPVCLIYLIYHVVKRKRQCHKKTVVTLCCILVLCAAYFLYFFMSYSTKAPQNVLYVVDYSGHTIALEGEDAQKFTELLSELELRRLYLDLGGQYPETTGYPQYAADWIEVEVWENGVLVYIDENSHGVQGIPAGDYCFYIPEPEKSVFNPPYIDYHNKSSVTGASRGTAEEICNFLLGQFK